MISTDSWYHANGRAPSVFALGLCDQQAYIRSTHLWPDVRDGIAVQFLPDCVAVLDAGGSHLWW